MNQNFDRAPGGTFGGQGDAITTLFNQREPLRQPRTSPPLPDNSYLPNEAGVRGDSKRQQQNSSANSFPSSQERSDMDSLVKSSNLSAAAPEFFPPGFNQSEEPAAYDESEEYEGELNLASMVTDFLNHLSSSPGSFESDIEYMTSVLNSYVTTEELLQSLVELIYEQSTTVQNFAYTGARLCNHLSKHLTANFRQLLLIRCQKEYEQRDAAVRGDAATQKKFHSYVLFLGELYLHLEIKGPKGPPTRAKILLDALKDLMNSLFSNPVDSNLICAVKLLKLTGSVLDDTWKQSGQSHMEKLIQRIETIVLDATCSRDVRQMLLKLVELRSSDWGRVCAGSSASNATPDNDPNYFMNEPTFYTEDGTPFTAADPEYAEKYQAILEQQDYFDDFDGENGNDRDEYDFDDEMEPEIEEAFERFCLESEGKRKH
ncbi:polyadenylate-binding protein-interacting protein 1 [Cynoglossus semilaevis]|uniref:Polyadenylate-binding protein-interacting protein 1 n=1 Tax=Cynoglossus semilaevis TaxID=244447 RepID=A0A3P8WXM6_CYNSE|nr:polyadenylate-binding protein-interacting protein 1-like [Cynoglossus semilaevis]